MLIKHHNKVFKHEDIVLNGHLFYGCQFINCNLIIHPIDSDDPDNIDTQIKMVNNVIVNCEYRGQGWPDDLLELIEECSESGDVLDWSGKIRKREKVTYH